MLLKKKERKPSPNRGPRVEAMAFFTPFVNQQLILRSFFVGIGMEGEILVIHNVSRFCDGVYQCVASNDVPPAVEMETEVIVECK